MTLQRIFLVVLLAVVAAAGWRFAQSPTFARWAGGSEPPPPPFRFDNGSARGSFDPEEAPASAPRAATGVHKCQRGNQVVYTDGKCPSGSKELDLTQGTVTVLPGGGKSTKPAVAAGDTNATPRSSLRDVLVPPDPQGAQSLKDQQMERVIGK